MTSVGNDIGLALGNTLTEQLYHKILKMVQLLLNRLWKLFPDCSLEYLRLVWGEECAGHQCIVPVPNYYGLMSFRTAHTCRVYHLVLSKLLHIFLPKKDGAVPSSVDDLGVISLRFFFEFFSFSGTHCFNI